jgi:branched-chain amino acid transport system substrate-binding protein
MKKFWAKLLAAGIILVSTSMSAFSQDAYVVGMTGALTGPAAGGYGPNLVGFTQYIASIDHAGGINGHPVRLVILDDQGLAPRAGADVRQLLAENKLDLLVNNSLSSTYLPVISDAKSAHVPLLFMGICPTEVYPPAQPLLFCPGQFGARYDTRAAFDFIKKKAGPEVRIGIIALSIAVSRAEADFGVKYAKEIGFTPVDEEIAPPTTPDYTPYATRLISANPTWVYAWGPTFMQAKVYEALRKLGWKGDFICADQLDEEGDLNRFKDPRLYVVGPDTMFSFGLPEQRKIESAAKEAKVPYSPKLLTEGWIDATVAVTALKIAGWPPSAAAVDAAMTHLKVDLKGLRGGELVWTRDNHFRAKQYYRIHHWSAADNKIVVAQDWVAYDVK